MAVQQQEQIESTTTGYGWPTSVNQIDRTLARHGVHTFQPGTFSSRRLLPFNVRDRALLGLEKLRVVAGDLSQRFGDIGEGLNRRNGAGELKLARALDAAVPLLDLIELEGNIGVGGALIGLDEDGQGVIHNFLSSDTPHLLVTGGERSGKTNVLRTLASSLALNNRQADVQLVAICPIASDRERQNVQSAAWLPLSYLPHMLCDVATRHMEIREVLDFISREIAYREKHGFSEPRIVVLIDQVDQVIEQGGRACAQPILRIAQNGEDVGIHLAMSANDADSSSLGPQLLTAVSVILQGRVSSPDPESTVAPPQHMELSQLLGEGDFLLSRAGKQMRMQAALIDDYDLHAKLTDMYRPRSILLAQPWSTRLQIKKPAAKPSKSQVQRITVEASGRD